MSDFDKSLCWPQTYKSTEKNKTDLEAYQIFIQAVHII
jgi:hypothetical protein